MDKKSSQPANEKEFERFVAMLVIVLSVIGIAVLIFSAKPLEGPHYFTALYFKPGSYSNHYLQEKNFFTYVIENHEKSDKRYEVALMLNNEVVSTKSITVKKGETFEELGQIAVNRKEYGLPVKIAITASNDEAAYDIYYWLRE